MNKEISKEDIENRIFTIRGLQLMLDSDLAEMYQVETKTLNRALKQDLAKYNAQYEPIEIETFVDAHDRFLLIDETELLHIGASLKDLGKKWFAFSKMNAEAGKMIAKLSDLA